MRKLIAFDPETWRALDLLAKDRMATIQELADEAFDDLLKKHDRPVTLKEALKQSVRRTPANDSSANEPAMTSGSQTKAASRRRRANRRKR